MPTASSSCAAGEIEQVGSPMDIYSKPVSYFVADFFGSPSMNLVAGEIVHVGGATRFRSPGFDLAVPERFQGREAGPATLGIRPEHVGVEPEGTGGDTNAVRLVEPLGKDTLLYFNDGTERAFVAVSEGLRLAVLKPAPASPDAGARSHLSVRRRRPPLGRDVCRAEPNLFTVTLRWPREAWPSKGDARAIIARFARTS